MMSAQDPCSYSATPKRKPRTKAPALSAFTPYRAPEPETYPQGQWPLLALKAHGQCHYPTGQDARGAHLFNGELTQIGPGNPHGSWCAGCRALVFRSGSINGEDE